MRVLPAILIVSLWLPSLRASQDTLERVRELYASAEYEEALAALARLGESTQGHSVTESDRYRVLCLMAVGRAAEAQRVMEGMFTRDPLLDPAALEAPPRIRAAFADARRRVLPGLARTLYADAKAAYDRKAFAEAVAKLERTITVMDRIESDDAATLSDLVTLAKGFLELSRAALPPPLVEAKPLLEAGMVAQPRAVLPALLPESSDPIAIRQSVPPWTIAVAGGLYEAELRGAIEVDIDEKGDVVGARLVTPIHPAYDALLLKAARSWKYEPARRSGTAVRMTKRVDVLLKPR